MSIKSFDTDILLLIITKEYSKAHKLIIYANKLKGVDLSRTFSYEALIYESKHDYEKALIIYKKARLEAYNEEAINHLNKEIKWVKMKKKYIAKANNLKEKIQEAE